MIPETSKLPGVCYAFAPDGVELPVIDITHPAFHQALSEEQQVAAAERFAESEAAKGPFKRWLQARLLPLFLKGSVIGRGLLRSRDGFLDGMSTYRMKLPPDLLGKAWATPMDRKLLEGMNGAGMSLGQRLQDMAEALAAALKPALDRDPARPLHLINIAGGPSMDSLNALILLFKERPALLQSRRIAIHVLDLEQEGAAFAAAALVSLQAEGGPLHGLQASLEGQRYDWSDPRALSALLGALPSDALVAVSSEGGLYDYADDAIISAHLQALAAHSPADTVLAASLSVPHQRPGGAFQRNGVAKVVLRSLEDLQALAAGTPWRFQRTHQRPIYLIATAQR